MYSTIEDLKTWFSISKMPCWILYSGTTKSENNIVATNNDVMTMEDSFQYLEDHLALCAPGKYFLVIRSSPNNGRGNAGKIFAIGDISVIPGASQGNSIGNIPSQFLAGNNAEVKQLRDEISELKLKLLQKENDSKIDDLRREMKLMKESNTVTNRLMGIAESNAPMLLEKLLGGKGAVPTGATVGVAGVDEEKTLSIDQLVNSAMTIQDALPDLDVNETIEQIAQFALKNPDQARNLLTMLKAM